MVMCTKTHCGGKILRALFLVFCLLFLMGVSLAEEPEKSPTQTPSVEKGAEEASAKESLTEQPPQEEKRPEVTVPEPPPEKKEEKLVNIEGGFAYKNVMLHQGSYTFVTQFEGDMVNNSGINYSIVKFVFSTYDSRGRLLTSESFHITDINSGQTKRFRGTAVDGFREIASFKITLKSGVAAAK